MKSRFIKPEIWIEEFIIESVLTLSGISQEVNDVQKALGNDVKITGSTTYSDLIKN